MSKFVFEIESISPGDKKLAEKLVKKVESYGHWPDSKPLGLKLLPFTESKKMVFLLAGILKADRIADYPELLRGVSTRNDDWISYCTFVHILIQYVLNQKEDFSDITTAISQVIDNAIKTVAKDEWDNKYYMLRWLFKAYKADKDPLLKELDKKFDAVPKDKLIFSLTSNSTYLVKAYSQFTSGDIKIPQSHNGKPVTKIATYGFSECKELTSIELPEGLETIEYNAFSNCGKLKAIRLPQSLKQIDRAAFYSCVKLSNVIIPQNVIKMGERIFMWIDPKKMSSIKVIGHKEKPEGWHEDWHKDSSLAKSETRHNVIWDYKE